MGFFNMFAKGLWYSLAIFTLVVVGDYFIPGKLAETVFTPLGILIIFIAFMLDSIWLLSPIETKKEAAK